MRRRLFTLLSAASVWFCVATCVLWVRSYRAADAVSWHRTDDVGRDHYNWYLVASSGAGGFGLCMDAEVADAADLTPWERARPTGGWAFAGWEVRRPPAYPTRGFFSGRPVPWPGFAAHWEDRPGTVLRDLIAPYWAVAVPAAGPPLVWLGVARRRRRRDRVGLCPACGYDLRASPGRCPECGAAGPHGNAADRGI